MTQIKIIVDVMKRLGGHGTVKDICWLGKFYIGDRSQSKTVEANIRRILNSNPHLFRHPDGIEKGEWELVAYRNELQQKDDRIKELEEENRQLKSVETKAAFQQRAVDNVIDYYKFDIENLKAIRRLLKMMDWGESISSINKLISKGEGNANPLNNGDIVWQKNIVQHNTYEQKIAQFAVENHGTMNADNKPEE